MGLTTFLPPCTPPSYRLIGMALLTLAATGCTRYDYALVNPPDVAGPVGRKAPTVVTREPLRYELLAKEDRLVMIVHNDADEAAVKLVGEDSYVVDPGGESHPLPTR